MDNVSLARECNLYEKYAISKLFSINLRFRKNIYKISKSISIVSLVISEQY